MSRASPSGRAGRASPESASGLGHPATIPDAWRCGHPRTTENTKRVRAGTGLACKTCFREYNRRWMRNKRARAKYDARELARFAQRFNEALRWLKPDNTWSDGPAPWTISNALQAARRNGLVESKNVATFPVSCRWRLTPLGDAALTFVRELAGSR